MKDWLPSIELALLSMIILRLLSGSFELTAAILMYKFNSIEKALAINAILAVVGPIVLVLTMTIGLVGIADQMKFSNLLIVGIGVALILYGLNR
ncbi:MULTISPECIES: YqhV family protein [Bacillaceae]|uniref:YqhV family protein n=1 Tax=Evansella alkalicola TaxID=745819 RepID=A0ABS6JRN2_9BACI|nr:MULTISPECIES: YqhV family protein [Bacillaceae]MBU9721224.1 YqhV family protein [Bacillus alkalicola]